MATLPPSPSAVELEVAGPPWLLPREGFLLCWVPPLRRAVAAESPCDGVPERGCISRPQELTTAQFKSGHRPSGHRTLDSAPFQRRAAARRSAGSGLGALGLLKPISLSLLLDRVSLSWEGSGAERGVLQNPGCGNQVNTFPE